MTWHNEPRRHSLAARGVRTGIKGKPIVLPTFIPFGLRYGGKEVNIYRLKASSLENAKNNIPDNQEIIESKVVTKKEVGQAGVYDIYTKRKVPIMKSHIPETININKIISANKEAGNLWFSPSTLNFFDSKFDSIAYLKKGSKTQGYFVSSEKQPNQPRKYTIRNFDLKTGEVSTSGEFQSYNNKNDLIPDLKELLSADKISLIGARSSRPIKWERSREYRRADPEKMKMFIGLNKKDDDGFIRTIDERDARFIVANLRQKEYKTFIREFKNSKNKGVSTLLRQVMKGDYNFKIDETNVLR